MLLSKKVICFDMDGLLFDTETLYFETRKEILKQYGYPFTIEDYIPYIGKSIEDSIERLQNHVSD